MRFELLFLSTVDPSLGRVDHDSFSHQTLMEMVIDGITNKEKVCGDFAEPKDIEEWEGVEIEDGKVAKIDWDHFDMERSLHLEWLPSSVRKCTMFQSRLTGTLDLASLPISMKELDLGFNAFTGSINLERLPERMESISVFKNKLSGRPDGWPPLRGGSD
ncbi:leucine-rich repeat protein [Perkinsela sp. CCAP 1560/4]|nr:leucine-rich repeat protein [Perkinsela sp. CCAP 1560/4]|eukprot:KNH00533.1 leucine-rich repeat protein [Perkinsela sp. CCAP 1560/4]